MCPFDPSDEEQRGGTYPTGMKDLFDLDVSGQPRGTGWNIFSAIYALIGGQSPPHPLSLQGRLLLDRFT